MIESTDHATKKRRSRTTKEATSSKIHKKSDVFTKEELDLKIDLYPLAHYLSNRETLAEHIFTIISEEQLRQMAPPGLMDYSAHELKQKCIEELMKLESDEILTILQAAGRPNVDKTRILSFRGNKAGALASTRTESSTPPKKPVESNIEEEDVTALQLCPDQYEIDSLMEDGQIKAAGTTSTEPNAEHMPAKIEENESSKAGTEGEGWVSNLARSQLEILELEMRARAIRSLMKAQGISSVEEESQAPSVRLASVKATNNSGVIQDEENPNAI